MRQNIRQNLLCAFAFAVIAGLVGFSSCCPLPKYLYPKNPELKYIIKSLDNNTFNKNNSRFQNAYKNTVRMENFGNDDLIADIVFAYPKYISPTKKDILINILIDLGATSTIPLLEKDENLPAKDKEIYILEIRQVNQLYESVKNCESIDGRIRKLITELKKIESPYPSTIGFSLKVLKLKPEISLSVLEEEINNSDNSKIFSLLKDILNKGKGINNYEYRL